MMIDAVLHQSRKRQISLIHVLRKQIGHEDSQYRKLLVELTGKDSSAQMDASERREVIDAMMRYRDAQLASTHE